MLAVLFGVIQGTVRIGKLAFARILAVCECHANTQRNRRKTIIRTRELTVDFGNLFSDGIVQITGHFHHDDSKFIATDTADIVN